MKFFFQFKVLYFYIFTVYTTQAALLSTTHILTISDNTNKSYLYNLITGDRLTTLEVQTKQTSIVKLQKIYPIFTHTIYEITTTNTSIKCTGEQLFYDVENKYWIAAHSLQPNKKLLSLNNDGITTITNVKKVIYKKPVLCYELTLDKPHTFIITKDQIVTHNFLPITIGLTFAFGEGISLSGISFGLGFGVFGLGISLYHHCSNQEKNKIKLIKVEQDQKGSNNQSPYDPDENQSKVIKVENMKGFFVTKFGREIKKFLIKIKERKQGQSVYKVTEKISTYGLKKNDLLYLDNAHKDHLEVFSPQREFKYAYNLNGTINNAKTKAGIGRTI